MIDGLRSTPRRPPPSLRLRIQLLPATCNTTSFRKLLASLLSLLPTDAVAPPVLL